MRGELEAEESEAGKAVEEPEPKRGEEVVAAVEDPKRLPVLPKLLLVGAEVAPKEVPEEAPKEVPDEAPNEVPVDLNPDDENPLTPEGMMPPAEPLDAPKVVPEEPKGVPVPPDVEPKVVPVPVVPNPLVCPLPVAKAVPVAPKEVPVAPKDVPVAGPDEAPKEVPVEELNELPVPNFGPVPAVLEKPELPVELEKLPALVGVEPKREEVDGVNPLAGAVVVVVEPNKLLTSVDGPENRLVAPPPPLPNGGVLALVPQLVDGVWLGFVVAAALKAANGFVTIALDGEEKLKAVPFAASVASSLCDDPPNIGFDPNTGFALAESLADVAVNVLVLLLRVPKAGFVDVGDEVEPAPNLEKDGPVAVVPKEVLTDAVSFAVDGANGVIFGNDVVGFSTSFSFD